MTGFWDSSALVPICVPGQSGRRARELLREGTPRVWWAAALEVQSAIDRLRRTGELPDAQAQKARLILARLRTSWREIAPDEEVRSTAEAQIERYGLKTGDALQLAAALVWCSHRPRRRNFISNDRRLAEAANEAGFNVVEV